MSIFGIFLMAIGGLVILVVVTCLLIEFIIANYLAFLTIGVIIIIIGAIISHK